jgi:hypothetical protein
LKKITPVLVLFVLSPLVAEYLSGSMSLAQIGQMLLFVPFYGGGAVLIREVARRLGRGWPTMAFLALAYGLIEEGIVLQSLFNPNFLGAHLLDAGFIPQLGIGAPWTAYVLGIHIIWSILVPVALTELLFSGRGTAPWLGRIGLAAVAAIYLAAVAVLTAGMILQGHFCAAPVQLAAVALAAAAAVGLAFAFPAGTKPAGGAPKPWLAGTLAFAAGSAFLLVYSQGIFVLHWPWQGVTGGLAALLLAMLAAGCIAARHQGWTIRHLFAATAGALLVYGWFGFITEVTLHGKAMLVAHAGLAAAMLILLIFAGWRAGVLNHKN